MTSREPVAALLLPIVIGIILWLPAWVFLAVVGAVVVAAGWELLAMARHAGLRVGRVIPLLLLSALLVTSWWLGTPGLVIATAATLVVVPTAQLAHPERPQGALAGMAVGTFVVLYLGVCGVCFGWLRTRPDDQLAPLLVLTFLICIWVGDSGAYYLGKNLGRHRMAPRVSPKKTWEGLLGGVLATFVGAVGCRLVLLESLAWRDVLVIAAILAAAAPVGDLIESLFKRDTGVKDSSRLLGGHGGLLDRTDSILYPAPLILAYLVLVGLA